MRTISHLLILAVAVIAIGLLALAVVRPPGPASSATSPVSAVSAVSAAERPAPPARPASPSLPAPSEQYEWHTFTQRDGLPSDKAHAVRVDGDRVWIGTDAGLVRYEDGRFHTYTEADGLSYPVVLAIDVDPRTGDVWAATMGGLTRFSAGRFDTFDQTTSGLANDVVYSVGLDGPYVWAATASGMSRFDTRSRQWRIYNETNTPMHEPWCYSVSADRGLVYVGAWGGGVLEFNTVTERWKDYRDPDEEMELDIFPDDGLVHDITSSLSYADGILWAGTYFGLSRFDGTRWSGYFDHDSGLASNFINFVRANGAWAWLGTDKGLSRFDGKTWYTYRRTEQGDGEVLVTQQETGEATLVTTSTAIAHNYVLGVDFQGETVWVATEQGVSRGVPAPSQRTTVPATKQ